MKDLCIDIFGTNNPQELKKIAEKAKKYDLMFQNKPSTNLRNAGRKPQFSEEDIKVMREMKENGTGICQIADQFKTTRQTIYKYLNLYQKVKNNNCVTMRMNYMFKDQLCTEIDIDFKNEKIYIQNQTDNLLHRAFGVITNPTWNDFQIFLEERCFPKERACMKDILRSLELTDYDPLQIVEKTKGIMAEDSQWIDIIYL